MQKNYLSVTFQGQFIKVIADGERDLEFVSRIWTEVLETGQKHNCFKVLGIANTTKPVQPAEYMMVVQENAKFVPESKYRIAWIETNREADETALFFETYLRHRGFAARVFSDVATAKEWLLYNGDA